MGYIKVSLTEKSVIEEQWIRWEGMIKDLLFLAFVEDDVYRDMMFKVFISSCRQGKFYSPLFRFCLAVLIESIWRMLLYTFNLAE